MIPTIEVSHLPSSSSFYATIMQPLGIHFLFASPTSPHNLHFGPAHSSEILFTLTESPSPKPSTLTLTASNSTQVTNFHNLALDANTFQSTNLIQQSPDAAVAKATDLDGNVLEVRYARSSPRRGSVVQPSPTTITTASTAKEARRVLDWQRDVARSSSGAERSPTREPNPERAVALAPPAAPPAPAPSQAPPPPQPQPAQPALQPSAAVPLMSAVYNEITSALPERISEGLSPQAILGTLIGAAAGAAVAYAMVRSEEPEPPRPQLVTYFTAPAAVPMVPAPVQQPVLEVARSKAPSAAGSRAGSNSGRSQRYVLRYNVGAESRSGSVRDGYMEKVDEGRSMHYSYYERDAQTGPSLAPGGAPSHVSKSSRRSEVRGIGHEQPLTVVSGASSKHYSEARQSHVSTKSDATVKPAKSYSKAGTSSRAGTEREGERSRQGTVVSTKSERKSTHTSTSERARRMPLPESVVGSVAPSDSISNIGMKSHYSRRDVY